MEINKGGRPKKVQIELNEESLKDVLQRVYVESEDLRQKSLLVFNKASKRMRENNDIALIGKTTSEYLKIASTATSTKLQVAKILQDHIIKNKTVDNESVNGDFVISDDLKEQIHSLYQDIDNEIKKLPEDRIETLDVEKEFNKAEIIAIDKMNKKND